MPQCILAASAVGLHDIVVDNIAAERSRMLTRNSSGSSERLGGAGLHLFEEAKQD